MAGEVKDLFVGVVAAATVALYAFFNMDSTAETPPTQLAALPADDTPSDEEPP